MTESQYYYNRLTHQKSLLARIKRMLKRGHNVEYIIEKMSETKSLAPEFERKLRLVINEIAQQIEFENN